MRFTACLLMPIEADDIPLQHDVVTNGFCCKYDKQMPGKWYYQKCKQVTGFGFS